MKRDLSESEWKLMQQLWGEAPLTIAQLTKRMAAETGWSKHTVISLLSRMEAKGAIRHEEGERAKRFYPVWEKNDAVRQETRHFLDRVFGGNVGLLVNAMAEGRELTAEDIAELSAILDKAKEGAK